MDRITNIIEEPFPEVAEIEVGGIPLRIATDESAHTDSEHYKEVFIKHRERWVPNVSLKLQLTLNF